MTGDQSDILQVIDEKISDQKYDEIIDLSLKLLLDKLSLSDESSEFLYELLEKITLICDKTPNVMKKITSMIEPLLKTEDECIQTSCETLKIPFHKLKKEFEKLPQDREYLLYCEKGIMSQLHAQYLRDDKGCKNIRVYRPE